MKGFDKLILFLITGLSFPLGYFIIGDTYKNYPELITFLSILIGFQITSLSILFNSKILKALYDNKIKLYRTELHRLKEYFKYSVYFGVISIFLILILKDCYSITLFKKELCLFKSILVFPIINGSIYCFYKIANELFRIFVLPRNE